MVTDGARQKQIAPRPGSAAGGKHSLTIWLASVRLIPRGLQDRTIDLCWAREAISIRAGIGAL